MSSWVLFFSLLFDLNSSQYTFDSFIFKGKKIDKGIEISIYSADYKDVDLIIIEKYDSTHKIYVKLIDISAKDLNSSKNDTFKYLIPLSSKNYNIGELVKIKFITKDRVIKIYNDIDGSGIFYTNYDKRYASLNSKNSNISVLNQMQKQALKKELKLEGQGYSILLETNYIELVYDQNLEKYFVVKYNQYLEQEKENKVFAEEEAKFLALISTVKRPNSSYQERLIETTWIELDDSFLAIFDKFKL